MRGGTKTIFSNKMKQNVTECKDVPSRLNVCVPVFIVTAQIYDHLMIRQYMELIFRMTIESTDLYGIHTECHKPTGIEESCVLNFYNDKEENLVTTAVNILSGNDVEK